LDKCICQFQNDESKIDLNHHKLTRLQLLLNEEIIQKHPDKTIRIIMSNKEALQIDFHQSYKKQMMFYIDQNQLLTGQQLLRFINSQLNMKSKSLKFQNSVFPIK